VLRRSLVSIFFATVLLPPLVPAQTLQREDEIVASLAGGRVIAQVAKDNVIIFAAINQPVEQNSVPPRVLQLDSLHIGVLFGASEWQIPSAPTPVRLDRDYQSIVQSTNNQHYAPYPGQEAPDLETIGIAFLEKLRPLVAQLHHKLDFRPDDALFELIILGFGPDYGPEVWQVEYRIEQQQVAARGEYWQTRILRPRFTQLYPPEGGKKAPHTLVEARYPPEDPAALASKVVTQNTEPPLIALIQAGDPELSRLRSGDPKFAKVMDAIDRGQAQKVSATDSADFLRAALPLISGGNKFFLGTMEEQRGFDWIVPPDEPVQKTDDKTRPPSAPSLRKKPTTP
jgi:hypothetical protein